MSDDDHKVKVLFVCFGNTCRSPLSEKFFLDMIEKKGLKEKFLVDSAALSSWQVGSSINDFAREILERIGIKNLQHEARQITSADYAKFDYILGMDFYHMQELGSAAEALESSAKILLLGQFNPNQADKTIRDPICGTKSDFEKCYEQISISCEKLLDEIITELKI